MKLGVIQISKRYSQFCELFIRHSLDTTKLATLKLNGSEYIYSRGISSVKWLNDEFLVHMVKKSSSFWQFLRPVDNKFRSITVEFEDAKN
jgi:hypothetical protein